MKNSVGTTEKIKAEESEDNKMKNLKTLQTLSKMGKILSRIAFVFARIGACGCIIGLLSCSYGAELSGEKQEMERLQLIFWQWRAILQRNRQCRKHLPWEPYQRKPLP